MRFAMNLKLAMVIMAHYATHAISTEHIQFVQSSQLPEPKLTTVLGDGIHLPIPPGHAQGTMIFKTEVCRPVTTTTCDVVQVTSVVTSSEVVETSVASVVTTRNLTSQVTATLSTTEIIETASAGTSATISSGDSAPTLATQSSLTETPLPTSGGQREAEGAGILAGLALLMLI